MNKIEIFIFGFSTLLKVSRTYTMDIAIEQQRDVVCELFSVLWFIFLGAAPIPYVQEAILNQPHT